MIFTFWHGFSSRLAMADDGPSPGKRLRPGTTGKGALVRH